VAILTLTWCACGRIGYTERPLEDAAEPGDALTDALIVDTRDAPAACPTGMTEIMAGSNICIEQAQRGNKTWTVADATCQALDRRLCADAEWLEGCTKGSGMTNTVDDWEWVAENDGSIAEKRGGAGACADTSSHEMFVDPYGFRCCTPKQ
jgi:hypothetical protein